MHFYASGGYVYTPAVYDAAIIDRGDPRHVFMFGNEFGMLGYVLAGDFTSAYEDVLMWTADRGEICDHGGDITDAQRWDYLAGISQDGACDCAVTEDGRFVWDVYLWVRPMELPAEMFELAGEWISATTDIG